MNKYKLALITALTLLAFPVGIQAAPPNKAGYTTLEQVQQLIADTTAPLQSAINSLTTRVTALEDALAPIEAQISGLQAADATQSAQLASLQTSTNADLSQLTNRISGVENRLSLIEQVTNDPDFQLTNTKGKYFQIDTDRYQLQVSTDATWKGLPVSFYQAQLKGVFHLPSGDMPFIAGSESNFFNTNQILSTPVSIPVDLYVYWQGTRRHITVTINIP